MIKINYPETFKMKKILDDYINALNIDSNARKRFDLFRKRIKLKHGFELKPLNHILVADFDELCGVLGSMPIFSSREHKWLRAFFKYDVYQQKISMIFMKNKNKISLKSCYYCNIDYISSFNDIPDYHPGLDFVKRASKDDLLKIKGIGKDTVNIILKEREDIESIDDLSIGEIKKQNLKTIHLNKEHNHFTLDHVIDKGDHPLFALSFYNFVPSCYSCNSKFKKAKKLISRENIKEFLSPTSDKFQFDNDVKFKILFYTDGKKEDDKEVLDITSENDFILEFNYINKEYKNYIDIFKLNGRYKFHKKEVVSLVEKSIKYPKSNLEKIANIVNKNIEDVKNDIFGKEIYDGELEEVPLTKFRRDIAEDIKLL